MPSDPEIDRLRQQAQALYEAAGALVGDGGYFDHSFLPPLKAAYDAFPAPKRDELREDLELLADALTTPGGTP